MKKILIIFFAVLFITLLLPLTIVYFAGQMPPSDSQQKAGDAAQVSVVNMENSADKSE